MIIKQLAFRDLVINTVQGGILLDNGNVICGCCGGIYEAADEGVTWKKLKVYNNWIDLTAAICGDDIPIEDDAAEKLPERISIYDIRRGLTDGDIEIIKDPEGNGLAAKIGEYWFVFSSDAAEDGPDSAVTVSAHIDTTPFEEDVKAIWETVNSEPINGTTEDEATECLYYKAVLDERFKEHDAVFKDKLAQYPIEDQISNCYAYLNWTYTHKSPYDMTEAELLEAQKELDQCEPGIAWVAHAGYAQAVPQDKSNGCLILG